MSRPAEVGGGVGAPTASGSAVDPAHDGSIAADSVTVTLDRARFSSTKDFNGRVVDVGPHYFSQIERRQFVLAGEERSVVRPRQIWGMVRPTKTKDRESPGYLVYRDDKGVFLDTRERLQIDTGHGIALSLGGSDTPLSEVPGMIAAGVSLPVYANFFPQAREMNEHADWRLFEDELRTQAELLSHEDPPRIIYLAVEPHYADAPEAAMELAAPTELRVFTQELPYHPVLIQAMENHRELFTPAAIRARAERGAGFMPREALVGLGAISETDVAELTGITAHLTRRSFVNTASPRDLSATVDELVDWHVRDIEAARRDEALHSLELVMRKDPAELAKHSIITEEQRLKWIVDRKTDLKLAAEAVFIGDKPNQAAKGIRRGAASHLARIARTEAVTAEAAGGVGVGVGGQAQLPDFYKRLLDAVTAASEDASALEPVFRSGLTDRGFIHPRSVLLAGVQPPRLRSSTSEERLSDLLGYASRLEEDEYPARRSAGGAGGTGEEAESETAAAGGAGEGVGRKRRREAAVGHEDAVSPRDPRMKREGDADDHYSAEDFAIASGAGDEMGAGSPGVTPSVAPKPS